MHSVYTSNHRSDACTIRDTLKKQGFAAEVERFADQRWNVLVPAAEYKRAFRVVWGDETPGDAA